MSDVAICIEHLSKSYRIGKARRQNNGRKSLLQRIYGPFEYLVSTLGAPTPEEVIWALRDTSFDVLRGDVVGVIGRNGAGKSTLLKLLSRITEPTSGRAFINGRVGSLLEVGTGFHPELTGRENIYLNGAIMGMKRVEIARKFDEIVAFAEVEKFIDTPVKRYSSGMYVRLAFAVAAHLEPEILLVDEVLAVGDSEFQKKCLGKMSDVAKQGRTVLFVSHNMAAVLDLCRTVYWLDQGKLVDQGDSLRVIQKYLSAGLTRATVDLTYHPGRRNGCVPVMRHVSLYQRGDCTSAFRTSDPFELEVELIADRKTLTQISLGVALKDGMGFNLFATNMMQHGKLLQNSLEHYFLRFGIPQLPLSPGTYGVSLFVGNGLYDLDVVEDAIHFDVLWNPQLGLSFPPQPYWGPLYSSVYWQTRSTSDQSGNLMTLREDEHIPTDQLSR